MGNVLKLAAKPDARASIVADLRKMADAIEAEEYGEVRCGMVLLDTPDALWRETVGPLIDLWGAIGILEGAKHAAIASTFGD